MLNPGKLEQINGVGVRRIFRYGDTIDLEICEVMDKPKCLRN